jgi:hypothetical protein
MELEKFDLERALSGDPVITKEGKEVTQLTCFKDVLHRDCVYGVVSNQVQCWEIDGSYFLNESDSKHNLFMKPKENTIWVNVYKNISGKLYTNGQFDSEQQAKLHSGDWNNYVKSVKIDDKID